MKQDRRGVGACSFFLVLGLLGCSALNDTEPSPRLTKSQAVLGGEPSDNEAVMMVLSTRRDSISLCTGSLIAPRLLLTARHCVSTYIDGDFSCTLDGEIDLSRRRTPANAGEMAAVLDGSAVSIYRGREPDFSAPSSVGLQVLAPETTSICRNDIALVVLDQDLDLPVLPLQLSSVPRPGELTTVVGYGTNEQMINHRRERSGVTVLAVGQSEFFDTQGQALPRTFVVERSVCPGDSGGPALSAETGEIVGVFSFYRGDCHSSETRNFFSQLAPYRELIQAGFEAVGMPFPPDKNEQPSNQAGAGAFDPELESPASASTGCLFYPASHPRYGAADFMIFSLLSASVLKLRRSRLRSQWRS